jgi:hypothetical protein
VPAGASLQPSGTRQQQQQQQQPQQQQQQAGGLGRLEIAWSASDGRSGRLQTQPIFGALPASSVASSGVSLGLGRLPAEVRLGRAFNVILQVEASPVAGRRAPGPLLLLHSDPTHQQQHQQQQQQQLRQQQPSEVGAAGVAVVGPRVVKIGDFSAGSSHEVAVRLLPLRRGWQRLPAFVVVDFEGAPCASMHDVSVLVM